MNQRLINQSLGLATATIAYIAIITQVMQNGERLFGAGKNFLAPIAFLTLFVISAGITSSLVLGKSVLLYLEGAKKEAVKLFFLILGWLALFLVIFSVILIIFKVK